MRRIAIRCALISTPLAVLSLLSGCAPYIAYTPSVVGPVPVLASVDLAVQVAEDAGAGIGSVSKEALVTLLRRDMATLFDLAPQGIEGGAQLVARLALERLKFAGSVWGWKVDDGEVRLRLDVADRDRKVTRTYLASRNQIGYHNYGDVEGFMSGLLRGAMAELKGKVLRDSAFIVALAAGRAPDEQAPSPESVSAVPLPESSASRPDSSAPRPSSRPDVYALVIGAGEFKSGGIPAVPFAGADAQAMYDLLVDPDKGGLAAENVRLLTGPAATLADIRKGIGWLVDHARANNGLALLYFSGHGAPARSADSTWQAFLVPYDCDPDYMELTSVAMNDVDKMLAGIGEGQSFVALDACFSGRGRSFMRPGQRGMTVVPRLKPSGRGVLLAACDSSQAATDYDAGKHGLFTYHLLDALAGAADETGNKDGWVDASEAYAYVRDNVRRAATQMHVEQEPELVGSVSDLRLSQNASRMALSSQDAKMAKVKAAYDAGSISPEQLEKARKEIRTGNESRILTDFLDGKVSPETFGELYR